MSCICKDCRYSDDDPELTRAIYEFQEYYKPNRMQYFKAYFCHKLECMMTESWWCRYHRER